MGKVSLPETIKVAMAAIQPADTDVHSLRIPLTLGKREVAILLSLRVFMNIASKAHSSMLDWGLWRKSDADWPQAYAQITDLAEESDIIAGGALFTYGGAGTGLKLTDDFIFPYPVVITRNPQFIYEVDTAGGNQKVGIMLYYLLQEVNDDTLARLMVKDHA